MRPRPFLAVSGSIPVCVANFVIMSDISGAPAIFACRSGTRTTSPESGARAGERARLLKLLGPRIEGGPRPRIETANQWSSRVTGPSR